MKRSHSRKTMKKTWEAPCFGASFQHCETVTRPGKLPLAYSDRIAAQLLVHLLRHRFSQTPRTSSSGDSGAGWGNITKPWRSSLELSISKPKSSFKRLRLSTEPLFREPNTAGSIYTTLKHAKTIKNDQETIHISQISWHLRIFML